jgi:hypothetical protein
VILRRFGKLAAYLGGEEGIRFRGTNKGIGDQGFLSADRVLLIEPFENREKQMLAAAG